MGNLDEAAKFQAEAIRMRPSDGGLHFNLGNTLMFQRKFDEAIASQREAIRRTPNLKEAHVVLGQLLGARGQYEQAKAELVRAKELGVPLEVAPLADLFRKLETKIAAAPRLEGVVTGKDKPRDALEARTLAEICVDKGRQANAVRLYREAFAADSKLADDLIDGSRYRAACAAASLGSERDQSGSRLGTFEASQVRAQAREWLRADVALRLKQLESGAAGAREAIGLALPQWKVDPQLAGVRDKDELAKLTESERNAWKGLWDDIDALLKRADQPGS
jgi:tetratricopeptide (TPR) repeat protein